MNRTINAAISATMLMACGTVLANEKQPEEPLKTSISLTKTRRILKADATVVANEDLAYSVDSTGSIRRDYDTKPDKSNDIEIASISNQSTIKSSDQNVSILDNNIDLKGTSMNIGKCGPSPMAPTEIEAAVRATAQRYNVDQDFAAAIAWSESGFDRARNSPAGARGPMQLIPETAARFGVNDICDAQQNIEGGVKYLRWLFDEFKNPLIVAAAYNAGEGRIYQYGGVPPFQETVGYVARVLNRQIGVSIPSGRKPPSNTSKIRARSETDQAKTRNIVEAQKANDGVWNF